MKSKKEISMLFASSVPEEGKRFLELVVSQSLPYIVHVPDTLQDADRLLESERIQLIITDCSFSGGSFVDWLSLWPRPYLLLAYYGEEKRIDDLIRDEACSFVMRDTEFRHLGSLPTMIRKVLNIRESLDRQNAHFQMSERRYLDLVSSIPDIVYTLDGDGRIIYINDSVFRIGYSPVELMGKHFSALLHEDDVERVSRHHVLKYYEGMATGPNAAPKLFDERRSGPRMTKNLVVRLKSKLDCSPEDYSAKVFAYGEISCVGIHLEEYEGSAIGTVGIIRDVTQRQHEELELRRTLKDKELLLRELHHRIKNNLQIISSLFNLNVSESNIPESHRLFLESQNQIQTIAMVHEMLYESDDLVSINIQRYLNSLVAYLLHSYEVDLQLLKLSLNCISVPLCLSQAIPLALLINELISNSIKHGLARLGGTLDLSLYFESENMLHLDYSDSGAGLPDDIENSLSSTLRIPLLEAFAEQLNGILSYSTAQKSFSISLVFPIRHAECLDDFFDTES